MRETVRRSSSFLRNALRSNAAFSGVSGLTFLVAAPWISTRMGIAEPLIVRAVGVSLLIFGVGLLINASRGTVDRKQAWLAVTMDAIWVGASAVLIAFQVLTPSGNWAVAAVADVVFVFAVLQAVGLRMTRRELHVGEDSAQ